MIFCVIKKADEKGKKNSNRFPISLNWIRKFQNMNEEQDELYKAEGTDEQL